MQFWDEVGAYLDFTNPETVTWWKAGVTKALLEYGIAAAAAAGGGTQSDNALEEIAPPYEKCRCRHDPTAQPLKPLHRIQASLRGQRGLTPDAATRGVLAAGAP